MNASNRKRIALDFLDILATRDVDKVLTAMTPEPSWGFFAQRFAGAEGVRAIVKASDELYQLGSQKRVIDAVYCDGDTVIIKTTMRAKTFKDEDYENLYIMIIHLDGEKVSLIEEFMDTGYANEKFSGWEMTD